MAARSLTAYNHGRISAGQLAADFANVWTTLVLYAVLRFLVDQLLYRKDEDWKDLVTDVALAPVRTLTLIGFPAQMIIEKSVKATRTPRFETVPVGFANQVLESLSLLSKGAGDIMTKEVYKSGPNKGKLKGPVELHRGFLRLVQNALMFYGVPEDVPRRIYTGWLRKEEKKPKRKRRTF